MPNDYIRVGTSKLPKVPKNVKPGHVQGLVRGARLNEAYGSGGTKGLVKELERQRDEDRAKAADQGRPQFMGDANTPERLKKYVEVGMREEMLDDATQRSALHAVITEGMNRHIKSQVEAHTGKPEGKQHNFIGKAKTMGARVAKFAMGGPVIATIGAIMRPTTVASATLDDPPPRKKK